jgi:hypothetical protein
MILVNFIYSKISRWQVLSIQGRIRRANPSDIKKSKVFPRGAICHSTFALAEIPLYPFSPCGTTAKDGGSAAAGMEPALLGLG